jgi:hypothetical protein
MISNMLMERMVKFERVTHLLANMVEGKSTRAQMLEGFSMPTLQAMHVMQPAKAQESVRLVPTAGIKHIKRVTDLLRHQNQQQSFTKKSLVAKMETSQRQCWEVLNAVEEACPIVARSRKVQ